MPKALSLLLVCGHHIYFNCDDSRSTTKNTIHFTGLHSEGALMNLVTTTLFKKYSIIEMCIYRSPRNKGYYRSVLKIRQSSILYAGSMGRWDKRLIDQVSHVPSIIFLIMSYRLRALKTLYFYSCKFIRKI